MRQSAETMEQHSGELNYQNEREEEHKHQSDGLQLKVFFSDVNLSGIHHSEIETILDWCPYQYAIKDFFRPLNCFQTELTTNGTN